MAGDFDSQAGSATVVVDTKAMRKFPAEMSIYAALEVVEIGTATLNVFFDSRALGKLP